MANLKESWPHFKRLLQSGINLIPVRDKDDDRGKKKVAFSEWKKYQTEFNTEENLWREMEVRNTDAAAIVCGAISGNLEIIDIDVKYRPGIDAQFFSDVKGLYPELFAKLRLHKTPSGGFHILYRIKDHAPEGNKKLSSRPATEEELAAYPKIKNYCFLETRGEGGYALTPPSLGYITFRDVPIPEVTWDERCTLIQLATMYNEVIKYEKPYEPTKVESSYYSTNPFEDFNAKIDPVTLMESYGWTYVKSNNRYDMFTRPGGKKGDIHGGFIKDRRLFYIFTTSAGLESERAYQPATIMAYYDFTGDRKATYAKLVELGYGTIKPSRERSLIAKGRDLPANASPEAKIEYDKRQQWMSETYPHGTFWVINDNGSVEINREKIYDVSAGLGYRWYEDALYQIKGMFVHKVIKYRSYYDDLKAYIREDDGDVYTEICNAFEVFVEHHGEFSASRIMLLDENELVRDTINTAYKFFTNGYMFITADKAHFQAYENLIGLILYDDVQQRIFTTLETDMYETKYLRFLDYAVRLLDRKDYIMPIIGYLAHRYKDETMAYIILLTEETQNPEEGGGAGKNVFCSLLSWTTTYKNIPASQSKLDERFLQPWNGERVLCLSDLPKHFDFLFLKELSSGDGLLKKLFHDQETVPVHKMPKIIAQTNYSWENVDGGLKRRIMPVEFTNYFTLAGGVDVVFGCHFPRGWELEDWAAYDLFMAHCMQIWLQKGKLLPSGLSEGGWLKQFENTHGTSTLQFINENIEDWKRIGVISNAQFNLSYVKFCDENGINIKFRKSGIAMSKAITDYCARAKIMYTGNVLKRIESETTRAKIFGNGLLNSDEPLPF